MTGVFADTSYYAALLNPDDALHAAAVEWSENFSGRIVLTEYVLVELGSYFSRRAHRRLFLQLVDRLEEDPDTEIIRASTPLLKRGLNLFSTRLDKDWSLTDCISFVVMRQRKLTVAMTADHHFEQAGFRAILM